MNSTETGKQTAQTQEVTAASTPEISGSKKRVATGIVNAAELFIDDLELDELFSDEIAKSKSGDIEPVKTLHGTDFVNKSACASSSRSNEGIHLDSELLPSVTDIPLTDGSVADAEKAPAGNEPMSLEETHLSGESLENAETSEDGVAAAKSLEQDDAVKGDASEDEREVCDIEQSLASEDGREVCDIEQSLASEEEREVCDVEQSLASEDEREVCDVEQSLAPEEEREVCDAEQSLAPEEEREVCDAEPKSGAALVSEVESLLGLNPGAAIEAACKALEEATRELNESYKKQSECNAAKVDAKKGESEGSTAKDAGGESDKGEDDSTKCRKAFDSGEAPSVVSKRISKKIETNEGSSMSEPLVALKTKTLIEIHSQLTNLTGKLVGQRPDWTDLETIRLPDRERECRRFYWHVEERQKAKRKDVFLIAAPEGAGKTSFLAGVYAQLARCSNDIVTIAPALSKSKRAFSAIRNILEQRLYLSASELNTATIQLRGAVKSMLSCKGGAPESEDAHEVEEAVEALREMWSKSQMSREAYRREVIMNMRPNPRLEATVILDQNGERLNHEGPHESPASDRRLHSMDSMIREAVSEGGAGERDIDAEVDPYIHAVRALFQADLRHNRLVLIFDDINLYDEESLALLARVYDDLPECPLTIILTMRNSVELPKAFRNIHTTEYELRSISDEDLTCFTQRILEQLSQNREKMIVPQELCRLVAQHACGSPKRALELMMTHFTPEQMLTWSDSLDKLRHEAAPASLLKNLKQRLFMLSERERTVLCIASILNGEPFTANTIDAVVSDEDEKFSSLPYLHNLNEIGFLSRTKMSLLQNTVTYIFKHEYERQAITAFVSKDIRHRVYTKAAQWYALNNPDNRFNETIGDLCFALSEQCRQEAGRLLQQEGAGMAEEAVRLSSQAQACALEAAHYYERVAYSALSRSQYRQAKKLFKKLLRALPGENIARCIQAVLDASRVYLSLGNIDDAMRLAHSAWRHAERYSAYSMAAASAAQVAEILLKMGNPRHVKKYISSARAMLNHCMIPSIMLNTYNLEIQLYILKSQFKRADRLAKKARAFADAHELTSKESLELRFHEAQIAAVIDNPRDAVMLYEDVLIDSDAMHFKDLYARTSHMMGSLLFKLDENDKAFKAWNKALGLAQEMNDMFLHASLLCDISESAIMLNAIRTARSANEQCLTLAQHLRQKELIGRCLVNNASLQYEHGQFVKAERTLRKVHKISRHLGNLRLTLKSVALMARCYANPDNEQHDFKRAGVLFERVSYLYESHGMLLELAALQPQYAAYFMATKQNIQAKNAFNRARDIYQQCGMTKAAAAVDKEIDKILQESNISDEDI